MRERERDKTEKKWADKIFRVCVEAARILDAQILNEKENENTMLLVYDFVNKAEEEILDNLTMKRQLH